MPLSDTSLAFNQKSSPLDKTVTRTSVPSGTSSFSKGSILPPLTTARILSCIGSSICIFSQLISAVFPIKTTYRLDLALSWREDGKYISSKVVCLFKSRSQLLHYRLAVYGFDFSFPDFLDSSLSLFTPGSVYLFLILPI